MTRETLQELVARTLFEMDHSGSWGDPANRKFKAKYMGRAKKVIRVVKQVQKAEQVEA